MEFLTDMYRTLAAEVATGPYGHEAGFFLAVAGVGLVAVLARAVTHR